MAFRIIRDNITHVAADALVNTANPKPVYAGGTDAAVYEAAGREELLAARRRIGEIRPGDARATRAFRLKAKYIIHTVGPVWQGGEHGELKILRSCYDTSLQLAERLGCSSIAFPLISTGIYGFPKDKALRIAISAFSDFLLDHEMDITLVVFDPASFVLSGKLFDGIDAYIDEHYVERQARQEYGYGMHTRPRPRRSEERENYSNWAPQTLREEQFYQKNKDTEEKEKLHSLLEDTAQYEDEELNMDAEPYWDAAEDMDAEPYGDAAREMASEPEMDFESDMDLESDMDFEPDTGGSPYAGSAYDMDAAPYLPSEDKFDTGSLPSPDAFPFEKTEAPQALPKASAPKYGAGKASDARESKKTEQKRPGWKDRIFGLEKKKPGLQREDAADLSAPKPSSPFRVPRSLDDLPVLETFQEMLLRLIREKGYTNTEVYKRAMLDRKLFYKIRQNRYYHPKRNTAIALAFALRLNLDETTDFLAHAGYALSPYSRADLIVAYFIANGEYDLMEVNLGLFDKGEECLTAY